MLRPYRTGKAIQNQGTLTRIFLLVACVFTLLSGASTKAADNPGFAAVLGEVQMVHASIESIRLRLGVSGALKPAFDIENASTYEVYFQALALFQKSNWLAREFGSSLNSPPPLTVPLDTIEPRHVLAVIEATHANLQPFQARLNLPEPPAPEH